MVTSKFKLLFQTQPSSFDAGHSSGRSGEIRFRAATQNSFQAVVDLPWTLDLVLPEFLVNPNISENLGILYGKKQKVETRQSFFQLYVLRDM
jgi:hypothetical protein